MPHLARLILLAVTVLMIKHTVADFYLQTSYQYLNKGKYGHPGGMLHSAIHVALTPAVYFVLPPSSLALAGGIALSEFVIHYNVDWLKERITREQHWTPHDRAFWCALGTDQLIHELTYIGIVALLVWSSAR